jgi:hypothetical protein
MARWQIGSMVPRTRLTTAKLTKRKGESEVWGEAKDDVGSGGEECAVNWQGWRQRGR